MANRWGNGCGNLAAGDLPFSKILKVDCDRHDICYECANHELHGWSRTNCDNAFRENMETTCAANYKGVSWWTWWTVNRWQYASCLRAAHLSYSAVDAFGDDF